VSDSTNVTKAAHRETAKNVPGLLDICDCVHHIQLTIKDITKLKAFKNVSPSHWIIIFIETDSEREPLVFFADEEPAQIF